jgi:hypothetical protein
MNLANIHAFKLALFKGYSNKPKQRLTMMVSIVKVDLHKYLKVYETSG